ncbi:hypothetical protein PO909_025242 [Leuciscus waleckii]
MDSEGPPEKQGLREFRAPVALLRVSGSYVQMLHLRRTGEISRDSFKFLADLLTEAFVMHGWLPLSGLGGPMLSVVLTRPSRHEYSTFSSCPASTHWCADYSIYFKTPVTCFPYTDAHTCFSVCSVPPFSVDS